MEKEKNILLALTFLGAGEFVVATPSIRILREARPEARIVALIRADSRAIELAKAAAAIDETVVIDHKKWPLRKQAAVCFAMREKRFDAALIYRGGLRFSMYALAAGARRRVGFDRSQLAFLQTFAATDLAATAPNAHRIDQYCALLQPLGVEIPSLEGRLARMKLDVPAKNREEADGLYEKTLSGLPSPLVGVYPGANEATRRWRPERFGAFMARLAEERGASFAVFGGPGEEGNSRAAIQAAKEKGAPPERIVMANHSISLLTMAALIARCGLFLSNDTGPMHFAAALGVPLVAIIRPENADNYRPLTSGSVSIVMSDRGEEMGGGEKTAERPSDSRRGLDAALEAARRLLNGERPTGQAVRI